MPLEIKTNQLKIKDENGNYVGCNGISNLEHYVEVSDEQPTDPNNKLWFKEHTEEIEIPTMDDLESVKEIVDNIADTDKISSADTYPNSILKLKQPPSHCNANYVLISGIYGTDTSWSNLGRNTYGFLLVINTVNPKQASSPYAWIWQFYMSTGYDELYYRRNINYSEGGWTAWKKVTFA